MRFARMVVIAGLVAAQCLIAAGTAHAASGSVYVAGDRLIVQAADREANRVSIRLSDGRFLITDVVALSAGEGCVNLGRGEVSCGTTGITAVYVWLGDGDDSAGFDGPQSFQATGGDGNDRLTGGGGSDTLSGGPGGDYLYGGSGSDALYGGPGADTLVGGLHADHLDGGPGKDFLNGSDAMRDSVNYLDRTNPVTINLATGTGGELLEEDTIVNVQDARGGWGDDTLIGDANHNWLEGNAGVDTIDGGLGSDTCLTAETVTNCE